MEGVQLHGIRLFLLLDHFTEPASRGCTLSFGSCHQFPWRDHTWGLCGPSRRGRSVFGAAGLCCSHALCVARYLVLPKHIGGLCQKHCLPHSPATTYYLKLFRGSDFPSWHICKCGRWFCPKVSFQKQYSSSPLSAVSLSGLRLPVSRSLEAHTASSGHTIRTPIVT